MPNDFLITFSSGGNSPERAEKQLNILTPVLSQYNVHVAWRFHPKLINAQTLLAFATANSLHSVDARTVDLTELCAVSDFAITDWVNSDAYKAVLCGTPTVTMLFPNDTERLHASGFINGIPPVVMDEDDGKITLNRWGAKSAWQVNALLRSTIQEPIATRAYTYNFRSCPFRDLVKPGARERIADAVMKYLD